MLKTTEFNVLKLINEKKSISESDIFLKYPKEKFNTDTILSELETNNLIRYELETTILPNGAKREKILPIISLTPKGKIYFSNKTNEINNFYFYNVVFIILVNLFFFLLSIFIK